MSPTKIAINGLGRIGRYVLKSAIANPQFDIVGVNDLVDPATLAHLLKYDSVFGRATTDIAVDGPNLLIGGKKILVTKEKDPTQLPWKSVGAQIVMECTGRFADRSAEAHLTAGARVVLISAPAKEIDTTLCFGVNHTTFDPATHRLISNASCTTNCLAPIAKVLHETYGIESGFMTTIHSYTADQRLVDSPHSDLRRARAAALSQIPTTTGAAKAVGLVLPELKGKLDGISIRVPTPNVSCLDFTAVLKKPATAAAINETLKSAANGSLRNVLRCCDEPLVSIDFLDDPHSSIVDTLSTATHGNLAKILAWYDNEAGFSCRMLDMAAYIGSRL